jgi:hypothetical protein
MRCTVCRFVSQKGPHRERTPLDVMDRVLDKGIVVEAVGGEAEPRGTDSSTRLAVFTVDAHVDIVTDLNEGRAGA